jgi:hypothetical protein
MKMLKRSLVALALGSTLLAPAAFAEPQPHMRVALTSLEEARAQLELAGRDKGGHRVKAISLINQAIEEVRRGVAYDNKR